MVRSVLRKYKINKLTALDYKPRILDPEIEKFPCLVHKLSVKLTALQYKPQLKMGLKPRVIMVRVRYFI